MSFCITEGNTIPVSVNIQILREIIEGKNLPFYAHSYDSGMDVINASGKDIDIPPGERALIPTGFAVEIPPGFEIQIRSKSGLALKKGIIVLNSPGTIDSGYRGEIGVILFNTNRTENVVISKNEKIAQIVLSCVGKIEWKLVEKLGESSRMEGGFGSTGEK